MNATPVAEVLPLLPNTMHCTLTAVPRSSAILFCLAVEDGARVVPAAEHGLDGELQLHHGVLREGDDAVDQQAGILDAGDVLGEDLLELGDELLQVLCGQVGVGSLALRLFFMTLMAFSNRSPSRPMTTLENIWMKRR